MLPVNGSITGRKATHSLSRRRCRYWPRCGRMLRWLMAALVLVMAGCKCTVFSRSLACQAAMAGEAALIAPVAGVKNLHENLQARREQRRLRRRVLAGDLAAEIECVYRCNELSKLDDRHQLREQSAAHLLRHFADAPPTAAWPVLMQAHAVMAMGASGDVAAQHWRRVAVLSARPEIVGALGSASFAANQEDRRWYTRLAVRAQESLMLLDDDTNPPPTPDDDASCKPAAAWPPAWLTDAEQAQQHLMHACAVARMMDERGS